jgi:pimeloyl-ACP methyl ester carboxylesterase
MSTPVVSLQPFYFGAPERRLFGIFHPAAAATAALPGVVLCPAFGQEAVRAHRMMRVLAERLVRAGHPVLRFDFYGTGDSMGEDVDGDLHGWADDVRSADRELRSRSSAQQTAWIGMRLGGSIALRAAEQAPGGLRCLVLWDPVLDGARYLQYLRERHVAILEEAFSVRPKPSAPQQALDPAAFRDEAIGFALPPALRQQMLALRPAGQRWPARPDSIIVLTDPADADGRDLVAACSGAPDRVQAVAVRHGTVWASDSADNGELITAPALMQLLKHAGANA